MRDCFQSYGKPRYSDPDQKVFEEIDSKRHSTANLLKLLKDPDPKMRTLAIAALYAKEDPSVLPAIAQLVDDNANTFSEPLPIARSYNKVEDAPWQVLTVGQVAKDVVRCYMEPAGFHYGVKGSLPNNPGFDQYWKERWDRKYCASWFVVKLQRASTSVSPTDKSRRPQIAAVKAALNKVPDPERDWILLWLHKEGGFDLFASESELVSAMKQLGPDKLLLMLQSKKVIDDPDMQPRRSNNYCYSSMQTLVLKHAKDVLRKDQANALLACDKWERDYQKEGRSDPLISPWWVIAAAQLDHKHAEKLLLEEFSHLDQDFYGYQKADLAAALFKQFGLKEKQFLLDRFYEPDSFMIKGQHSFYRQMWLQGIANEGASSIAMLKAIVEDSRFNQLNDSIALTDIATAYSHATRKTVELEGHAWHPLGLDAACGDNDKARTQYPKETKELLDLIASWRQTLKKIAR